MKILTLSNCPLVESQGSGYVVLNFVRGLRDRGHEVDAFGPEDFEFMPWLRRGKNLRLAAGMLWLAFCRLLRQNYDVVEFYGGQAWLAAALLRFVPNRRFLMVNHSNGLEPHCESARKKFAEANGQKPQRGGMALPVHWAYTKVDAIVTVSQDERRFAVQSRFQNATRVAALENALPEAFLNLPVEQSRPPVILYCGSWLPRKGTATLIADLPCVLREFPQYRLKLVGVGKSFRKAACFPADILERIEVVPFLSDKLELRRQYQSARVVVVPSIYESFGLVTAEAMACGCAVVTTDVGLGADLKAGEEAAIMRGRASPALYQSLRELLSDEKLCARLALHGHMRVQRLRWKPAIEELERAYGRWLQERRKPAGAFSLAQTR